MTRTFISVKLLSLLALLTTYHVNFIYSSPSKFFNVHQCDQFLSTVVFYGTRRLLQLVLCLNVSKKNCLHQASNTLNIPYLPHDYTNVKFIFSLSSLTDRQQKSNLSFLSNLLKNKVDCPDPLTSKSFTFKSFNNFILHAFINYKLHPLLPYYTSLINTANSNVSFTFC